MSQNSLCACSLRQLARALLAWGLAALILLFFSALILSRTGTGSQVLGYLSSAMSFLAALAAGFVAGGRKGSAFLFPALVTAGFLVLVLLTAGSLLGSLNPSGILSVVSFTFTGVLSGFLLVRGRRRSVSARSFHSRGSFRSKPSVR